MYQGEIEFWSAAASFLSECSGWDGAKTEHALRQLEAESPELARAAREQSTQWLFAKRDEIVPVRGFNLWFPRRVSHYQILNALSQTAEETVCLGRNLHSGQILGLKLLAPGSSGRAEQLREGIDQVVECGRDQDIAYCAFVFGEKPVLASTRDLIESAKQIPMAAPAIRPMPKIEAAAPAPSRKVGRMGRAFALIVERIHWIRMRPSFHKSLLGVVAIGAGALLFAGSALSQWGQDRVRKTVPEVSANPALRELTLDQLDRSLAENPQDAQASALRAILLAQQKSRLAWKDYETVQRAAPNSFAAGLVEDLLENQLGPKPRTLPSSQESASPKPSSALDYSLLGLQSTLQRHAPANAAFAK